MLRLFNCLDIGQQRANIFKVTNVDAEGQFLCAGKLEISDFDLVLHQKDKPPVRWPLRCLRRYGFDTELFSFECGRRCHTGPGIYAFRCKEAGKLFTMLRDRIESSSEAGGGSSVTTVNATADGATAAQSFNRMPRDSSSFVVATTGTTATAVSQSNSFAQSQSSNSLPRNGANGARPQSGGGGPLSPTDSLLNSSQQHVHSSDDITSLNHTGDNFAQGFMQGDGFAQMGGSGSLLNSPLDAPGSLRGRPFHSSQHQQMMATYCNVDSGSSLDGSLRMSSAHHHHPPQHNNNNNRHNFSSHGLRNNAMMVGNGIDLQSLSANNDDVFATPIQAQLYVNLAPEQAREALFNSYRGSTGAITRRGDAYSPLPPDGPPGGGMNRPRTFSVGGQGGQRSTQQHQHLLNSYAAKDMPELSFMETRPRSADDIDLDETDCYLSDDLSPPGSSPTHVNYAVLDLGARSAAAAAMMIDDQAGMLQRAAGGGGGAATSTGALVGVNGGGSGSSADTAAITVSGLKVDGTRVQGYVTIDFDRTAALSQVAANGGAGGVGGAGDDDLDGLRKTRHNSTARYTLNRTNSCLSN